MEFRWVAAITLWTMLSGPVFALQPSRPAPPRQPVGAASAAQASPPGTQLHRR
jgi:hypothetical protein